MRRLIIAVAACCMTSATAQAAFEDEPLDFELDGYWKARFLHIGNLFLTQGDFTDIGRTAFEIQ